MSRRVLSFKDDLSQSYIYAWNNEQKLFVRDTAKRIAELFEFPVLVNIGVEYGGSMYCMRLGAPRARLIGVDIKYLKNVELSPLNAELIEGDSNRVHIQVTEPIHMILIDGGHDYETVKGDILGWLDKVVIGGVALFHDVELLGVSRAINDHLPKEWVLDKYIRGPFEWSGMSRYWKS